MLLDNTLKGNLFKNRTLLGWTNILRDQNVTYLAVEAGSNHPAAEEVDSSLPVAGVADNSRAAVVDTLAY